MVDKVVVPALNLVVPLGKLSIDHHDLGLRVSRICDIIEMYR